MKKFLIAVLIVVGNLFLMSAVDAEIKTYTGTDEYVVGENETHETAKKNSKIRAMRNAQDQAGVYIRSRSRTKDLELVEDEVITLTEGILKVVGAPNHEIRLLGDGKGVLIVTTIKVEIDTDDLDRRLAEIARTHSANKPPIDRPKPLETPEPEKISPPPEVDNIALSKQKSDEAYRLSRAHQHRKAISVCEEALRLNPNNAEAYEVMGRSYNGLKKFQKGIDACNKALQINPNSGVAYERLAVLYNSLKKYDEAILYSNKAMEVEPDWIWSYVSRADAYRGLKNYRQALIDYTKAIQSNLNHYWAYIGRAQAYEALGEHEKARADFAKARQLGWKG